MNLETKITIYKFTPQLFTLTQIMWHTKISHLFFSLYKALSFHFHPAFEL